jgi:hypothetical protein
MTRVAWVSDEACSVWEPRIARIAAAWGEVEIESVRSGMRRGALTMVSPVRYFELMQTLRPLTVEVLAPFVASTSKAWTAGQLMSLRVAIGSTDDARALRTAGDSQTAAALLGYPECCAASFDGSDRIPSERLIELDPPSATNLLLRSIGVRRVPHLPCSFDCTASVEFARRFAEVFHALDFDEELEWIDEMLAWPIEWSALHGIAEIRTPLLKIATDTDATAEKHVVRTTGSAYPDEGARGIVFPYTRARQLAPPAWLHTDNGFRSAAAMRHAHDEIVRLAVRSLREDRGPVVDLGCGNGVLLDRISRRADVPATGIELDGARVEHGRTLYPAIAFQQGDLFEPFDGDHALALMSAARLIERPGLSLRGRVRRVILYQYSDLALPPEELVRLLSSIGATPVPHLATPAAVTGCYTE